MAAKAKMMAEMKATASETAAAIEAAAVEAAAM